MRPRALLGLGLLLVAASAVLLGLDLAAPTTAPEPAELYRQAAGDLAGGDLQSAAAKARLAARRGGARYAPLRDFLLGHVAWRRSVSAEAALRGPLPAAGTLDRALAEARAAARSWRAAALGRADWPEARRNAERALRRVAELERRRQALQPRERAPGLPPPDTHTIPRQPESPGTSLASLSPARLQEVMARLQDLEGKRPSRRPGRLLLRRAAVEKDW